MIFLDTNVLLYRIDHTPQNRAKQRVALQYLERTDIVVSTQVLIEFCNNAFKPKTKSNRLTDAEVWAFVNAWLRFEIVVVTSDLILAALQSKERFRISHLDALIIETARSAGCTEVYSEDLSETQNYGGVRVINPFRQSPEARN
jgi:predicted nucleic acid-binding protein